MTSVTVDYKFSVKCINVYQNPQRLYLSMIVDNLHTTHHLNFSCRKIKFHQPRLLETKNSPQESDKFKYISQDTNLNSDGRMTKEK